MSLATGWTLVTSLLVVGCAPEDGAATFADSALNCDAIIARNTEIEPHQKGRILSATDACQDLEPLLGSLRALDQKNFGKANVLGNDNCVTLQADSDTSRPYARYIFEFTESEGSVELVCAETDKGAVWIMSGDVEFDAK